MKLYGGIVLHSNNSVVALLDEGDRAVQLGDAPPFHPPRRFQTSYTRTAGASPASLAASQKSRSNVCITAEPQAARCSASAKSAPCAYQSTA